MRVLAVNFFRRLTRGRWPVLFVVLLALIVRGWAALMLPVDADEPVYLDAGYAYAQALRAGDWNAVADYQGVSEHPALVKVLYGSGWLVAGDNALWTDALYIARGISTVFGTLAVLLVALLDPLAGGLLAVHTLTVKYTSQAYLEALPLCMSLVAVLAFLRAKSPRDVRFWLSAAALGLTAAGKFTYFPVIFPLAFLAIGEKKTRWPWLLTYLLAATAAFVVFNPLLWRDPVGRLSDALFFHVQYSQGAHVQSSHLPWYQPLVWISQSVPWHPEVFFLPGLDGLVFILGLIGLGWEWRARRWSVIWLAGALAFLFIWPTKWPQYAVLLAPLFCLAAATMLRRAYQWASVQHDALVWLDMMLIRPPQAFWILSIGFVTLVGGGYMLNNIAVSLERLKWQHVATYNSYLPSNTIHTLLALSDGRVALATEHGLAFWTPYAGDNPLGDWEVFTATNSPLPHNRVLALADDGVGGLWIGTDAGLAYYRAGQWQVFRAADYGLDSAQVRALALGRAGRVWIGANAGVAAFDGQGWETFTPDNSGLCAGFVAAILSEPHATGERLWFGTAEGVSVFDTATGTWTQPGAGLNWGRGVVALARTSDGRIWAATLGAGLGAWDGQSWAFYRTGNSDLPFNTVTAITATAGGAVWVGGAHPTQPAGAVARFDGVHWRLFRPNNSGYQGAEPLAIALVHIPAFGDTVWISTRTLGLDIYLPNR